MQKLLETLLDSGGGRKRPKRQKMEPLNLKSEALASTGAQFSLSHRYPKNVPKRSPKGSQNGVKMGAKASKSDYGRGLENTLKIRTTKV